jgi:hypothetical protein
MRFLAWFRLAGGVLDGSCSVETGRKGGKVDYDTKEYMISTTKDRDTPLFLHILSFLLIPKTKITDQIHWLSSHLTSLLSQKHPISTKTLQKTELTSKIRDLLSKYAYFTHTHNHSKTTMSSP